MESDRLTLLLELNQEMRADIKKLREEMAELRGARGVFGKASGWLNGVVAAILIVYVEWKLNRLN